jgi:transcriptional regulator with XRE-family HTH domain
MAIADIEPEYKVRRNGIDVQGLNSDGLMDTRETTGIGQLDATDRDRLKLSANQHRAMKALLSQEVKESLASVAARAGVSRNTIWRYMKDETFAREYRRITLLEVKAGYAPLMKAIMRGAMERGPGQAALARVILEKIGDPVIDHSEHTNRQPQFDIDDLQIPIDVKRAIVAHMEEIETLLAPYRPGAAVPSPPLPPPMLKLGPPRNVTPLEEVELHPAPCDSITQS